MLEHIFEWERLVHPTPTEEKIASRKAIVSSILSSFDSQKDVKGAMSLTSAALTGLSPSIQADVDYAASLTKVTKEHQQAFPSSLTENALDLQLSACLALGEVLTRKPAKGTWKEPRELMAGLACAVQGLQPIASGIHLTQVLDALHSQSRSLLGRKAIEKRERPECDFSAIDELAVPADVPAFWEALKPVLQDALETVARASAIDRDELEVLWWLYNDTSETFLKQLSDLNEFDVAFATSLELVDRALCPAPPSLKNIIHGLVLRARTATKAPTKTLKALINGWNTDAIVALSPEDDEVRGLVQTSPKLLPLTWIASKVRESGVVTGWEQEFEARTGVRAAAKVTAEMVADQVFAERTAQQLFLPLCGE